MRFGNACDPATTGKDLVFPPKRSWQRSWEFREARSGAQLICLCQPGNSGDGRMLVRSSPAKWPVPASRLTARCSSG